MTIVIIPIAVLILIIMLKQIPFIGGKVQAALLIGAALCLLMGGEYDPAMWLEALITGADKIAWVICLTLVFTVFCAKVVGCLMPMISTKLGLDPAALTDAFLTTIVDVLSRLIYFQFARLSLRV